MRKFKGLSTAIAIAGLCVGASISAMGSITFVGSSGSLAASADFALVNNTLTVTLWNTATTDVLVPTDVLTGVFFNTSHGLTAFSASLNGSTTYYAPIVNNVGEGWQYGHPVSAQGMNSGISAAGLGVFGDNQWFSTPPVTPLDGTDYGILSGGDDAATGNTGVVGHGPLIKNSIQFTLVAEDGFSLAELGNSVVFQYGTALSEPSFVGTPSGDITAVPEPATVLAGALLLLPFGASAVRIIRRKA